MAHNKTSVYRPKNDYPPSARCRSCDLLMFSAARNPDGLCDICGGYVSAPRFVCPSCQRQHQSVLHHRCDLCGWKEKWLEEEEQREWNASRFLAYATDDELSATWHGLWRRETGRVRVKAGRIRHVVGGWLRKREKQPWEDAPLFLEMKRQCEEEAARRSVWRRQAGRLRVRARQVRDVVRRWF
jgi:hypothetical protein